MPMRWRWPPENSCGIAVDVALVEPHLAQQLADDGLALDLVLEPVDQRALAHDLADGHPRVERRVRVLEDDLDVLAELLQLARRDRVGLLARLALLAGWAGRRSAAPLNSTVPDVGGISPSTTLPRVVFPQPDSPTSPSVSPRRTSNDTPSTARTEATLLTPEDPAADLEVLLDVADGDQDVVLRRPSGGRAGPSRCLLPIPAARDRRGQPDAWRAHILGRIRTDAGRLAFGGEPAARHVARADRPERRVDVADRASRTGSGA